MKVLNCNPDWLNNTGGTVMVIAEYKVSNGTTAYIASLKNDVIYWRPIKTVHTIIKEPTINGMLLRVLSNAVANVKII